MIGIKKKKQQKKKEQNRKKRIILYTGTGGGKTTSALGLAMRALGHGQKVVVVQFLKGRKDVGEYKIQRLLSNFEVHQFGSRDFIDLRKPPKSAFAHAEKGIQFIEELATKIKKRRKKVDMLILDELNLAVAAKLLSVDDVVTVLRQIPKTVAVIITGRFAPKKLIQIADIASDLRDIKRSRRLCAEKGIEY